MSTALQRKLPFAVLLLAGACGSADPLVDAATCAEGLFREGETACGLNGVLLQACEAGQWQDTDSCIDDPAGCQDADTRPGTTPCGWNGMGVLEQACQGGQWQDTAVCDDPDDCRDTDLRDGIIPCGWNGRGFYQEECAGGRWTETLVCNDPDDCLDTDTQPGPTACGLNDRGTLTQACVEGQWQDTDGCVDPDECVIGSTEVGPPCGPLNNGNLTNTCPDGTWVTGDLCDAELNVHLVRDISPNAPGSFVPWMVDTGTTLVTGLNAAALGDRLVFTANDGTTGAEVWITDGTEAGTARVADLIPGAEPGSSWQGSGPGYYAPVGNALYFSSIVINPAGAMDSHIYVTDGTPTGTAVVYDLDPVSSARLPIWLTPYQGGLVFFTVNPTSSEFLLWQVTPGLGAPTLVKQLTSDSSSLSLLLYASESPFAALGGKLYFTVRDASAVSLWVTDGTPDGTVAVKTHPQSSSLPFTTSLSLIGAALWYSAPGATGWDPWVSDGTADGTALLKELSIGTTLPGFFFGYKQLGASVYFLGEDGANFGLWASGGTAASTVPVKTLYDVNTGFSLPSDPLVAGERLFFGVRVDASSAMMRLWTSDGTFTGTHALIPDGPVLNSRTSAFVYRGEPLSMAEFNGLLLFVASNPAGSAVGEGVWLWRSDGTETGTWPFFQLSTNPAQLTSFTRFLRVGTNIYFNYDDGSHGTEPWVIELGAP